MPQLVSVFGICRIEMLVFGVDVALGVSVEELVHRWFAHPLVNLGLKVLFNVDEAFD